MDLVSSELTELTAKWFGISVVWISLITNALAPYVRRLQVRKIQNSIESTRSYDEA